MDWKQVGDTWILGTPDLKMRPCKESDIKKSFYEIPWRIETFIMEHLRSTSMCVENLDDLFLYGRFGQNTGRNLIIFFERCNREKNQHCKTEKEID